MDLEEKVIFQNSHWKAGKFETFDFKRNLFTQIWQDINTKPIGLLTGPRRVGKSVLLKQLTNEIIAKKDINPRQILYYEFSPSEKPETIWDVFSYFTKDVADTRLPIFLFFDEIQYLKGYESTIKNIYDNRGNCKIFIAGSLSLSYKRKMQESLAGRFFPYRLFPLNFAEYLQLANPESYKLFGNAFSETDIFKRDHLLTTLNTDFRRFLSFGRFPEIIGFSEEQAKSYLANIISQSLNQDVFSYFEIEKPQVVNAIFEYIRQNNGGLISVNNLANQLGVSNQTVTLYISILEQMGIIYLVYNTINPAIRLRGSKKAYVNSSFAILDTKLDIQTATGAAIKSYILERLLEKGEKVTFWRKRNKEIDFILPKKKTGLEIKFRTKAVQTKNYLKGFDIQTISLREKYPACLF